MTDTDALVEAVAEAMFKSAYGRHGLETSWAGLRTEMRSAWLSNARTAFSAIEAAGWRVVPVEPTKKMIDAMDQLDWSDHRWPADPSTVWTTLLSAAPRIGGEK